MNIHRLKATLFAIKKHYYGYQLLRNPKGTSPTTVRLIRKTNYIKEDTLDTFDKYHRITADFSKDTPEITDEFLSSTHYNFYNEQNQKISEKKVTEYIRSGASESDKKVIEKNHGVNKEELDSRNLVSIHTPKYDSVVIVPELSLKGLGAISVSPVKIKRSFAFLEAAKYNEKQQKQNVFHKNFWTTLLHNFKNN